MKSSTLSQIYLHILLFTAKPPVHQSGEGSDVSIRLPQCETLVTFVLTSLSAERGLLVHNYSKDLYLYFPLSFILLIFDKG